MSNLGDPSANNQNDVNEIVMKDKLGTTKNESGGGIFSTKKESKSICTGMSLLQQVARNHAEAAKSHATVLQNIKRDGRIPKGELPAFLKLNIGGTPYRLSSANLLKRGEVGLMYKFFSSTHEKRLQVCHGYIAESDEYYFERPACYFNPIYAFYTTGVCCQPGRSYMNSFFDELSFWGLTKTFFPELNAPAEIDKVRYEDFTKVRFGKLRRQVWNLFEVPESSRAARIIAVMSVTAVLLSTLGLVCGSMDQFKLFENATVGLEPNGTMKMVIIEKPHPIVEYVEMACIAFFTVEYFAKMLAAHDRRKVFLEPMNLIDLLAIIPFYLELLMTICGLEASNVNDFQGALLVMRVLRISRVIRLLKLGRHSRGLKLVGKVIESSLFQFGMVAMSTLISLVFFSTLIYFAEKDQPNNTFTTIPHSLWWAIVTMTTVGYGDMVPQSAIGKLIASITIAVGVMVCALPITVMVDNFVNVQKEFEMQQAIRLEGRKLQFSANPPRLHHHRYDSDD